MTTSTRLTGLRTRMADAGIDVSLILAARDIYYYAHTMRPARLLVTPTEAVLFVRRGYEYAREEATVPPRPGGRWDELAATLQELGLHRGRMGTELDIVPVTLYRRLARTFEAFELVDVSPLILEQRAVKDAAELAHVRASARATDAAHQRAREVIRPGLTELELVAEVEAAKRKAGNEGPFPWRAFDGANRGMIVTSGPNLRVRGGFGLVATGTGLGSSWPYGASRRRLEPGDLVMVDVAAVSGGYYSDQARTYSVGPASERAHTQYRVARAVHAAMLAALRPGVTPAQLYAVGEEVVSQAHPPHIAAGELSLPGFAGHGLGLESDEPPVIWSRATEPLQAGMVLAIEIEVVSPDLGTIKLEDTAIVTGGEPEIPTLAPRELIEIDRGGL